MTKPKGSEPKVPSQEAKHPRTRAPRSRAAHNTDSTGFPIVGIGASAGGLAAFEAFFSAIPTGSEPNMAFVLVQHLAPDHKSILTELIARYTRMEVFEVEDGMVMRPNCAYIIPPAKDMILHNGALLLLDPTAPRGQRLPIDNFFRSLAEDQQERAICIVLSGTGTDGTLGLRAIKGAGGMAMAQNPESTEFDGMPSSAIGTGLVDYVLPPAEMPDQLMAYVAHAFTDRHRVILDSASHPDAELQKVFSLLRMHTGNDFSLYKQTTIVRRIERRMAVNQIERLVDYVRYLQRVPEEVEALFRDLLIGVTSFFRDPEVFEVLQSKVLSEILKAKSAADTVRIWVPACSTGEEAYSIAILLHEQMVALAKSPDVKIFATDIDPGAIDHARAGVYPASIAADLSADRLTRYFSRGADESVYRLQKVIRDMLIFSEQNVTKDPPFSRLDLISCRNLLIYMRGSLQKSLVPVFHYALDPGGYLCVGTSESLTGFDELFAPVDAKAKIYRRKDVALGHVWSGRGDTSLRVGDREGVMGQTKKPVPNGPPLRELTERELLRRLDPVAALVTQRGEILYLHGRTGLYLEPSPGEPGMNILKMAREGLKLELATALRKAAAQQEPVSCIGILVKTNGDYTSTDLTVARVDSDLSTPTDASTYLVILEKSRVTAVEAGTPEAEPASVDSLEVDARIAKLRQELQSKGENLQSAIEEMETSNEELQSANEEMQSTNEELQAVNEELETSKEELQSVNEELSTVNAELQHRVSDLSRANNDMNNLLAGTGIGTVFVDSQLCIKRFTPAATHVINFIPSDTGRPLGHIVSNLVNYTDLVGDTQSVLNTLENKQLEVQTKDGDWYLLRIRPYRTTENVIDGAVITFTEISELKKAQHLMLESQNDARRLAVVVRDANDAILVYDLSGQILAWNQKATATYGWTESEALGMNIREITPEEARDGWLEVAARLSQSEVLEPYRLQRITKKGTIVEVTLTATSLIDESGEPYAITTTEREVVGDA